MIKGISISIMHKFMVIRILTPSVSLDNGTIGSTSNIFIAKRRYQNKLSLQLWLDAASNVNRNLFISSFVSRSCNPKHNVAVAVIVVSRSRIHISKAVEFFLKQSNSLEHRIGTRQLGMNDRPWDFQLCKMNYFIGCPRTINNIVDVSRVSTEVQLIDKYSQYRIDDIYRPFQSRILKY